MAEVLNAQQASRAMTPFVMQCFDRPGDDMASLFAAIGHEADGGTLDPVT